jgi:putative transcriptional regulator
LKKPKQVSDVRLFLGRSQWGPEQLRDEMEGGSWYGEQEENRLVFSPAPESVWPALIEKLEPGNLALLSSFYLSEASRTARERMI